MTMCSEESLLLLTDILADERERQCKEGLEAAKKGKTLPPLRPFRAICANVIAGAQDPRADYAAVHEAKRRRLADAVSALGLVEPNQPSRAPGATPLRTHTPGKGITRATPKPQAPTPANDKKRKIPPTPAAALKKTVGADTPRAAQKDIKTEQWNQPVTRYLMTANQAEHQVHKVRCQHELFTFSLSKVTKHGLGSSYKSFF